MNYVFANFALAVYPLFMLALFYRYRPPEAVALSLLISEMALPPNYTLPIHPNWLGKGSIPPFVAWVLIHFFGRSYLRGTRPFRGIELFFLLWPIGCFFTWWTNRDPIQYGPVTLLPQLFVDFVADVLRLLCDPWVVFFLGRIMFRTSRDLIALYRLTAICIAVYTLPILFEIRMSPQVNHMVYGYMPSGWGMVYRWGGYRPLVCFPTGLHLASFVLVCTIMVITMARSGLRFGNIPTKILSVYLVVVLVLCKSTGAIVYAAVLIPFVLFLSPRRMLTAAKVITILFLLYPILRWFDLIPTKAISDFFAGLSTDRAGSLAYRFDMEQGMLDLTKLRPWWGWGGYSRGFVHDPVTGETLSIPDGAVVIGLSVHGWVGLAGYFLPYAYAILRVPRFIRKIKSRTNQLLLSALALNCSVIMLDLIFNTSFFPIYMLLVGALYGLSSGIVAEEARKSEEEQGLLAYAEAEAHA
jgi:hypothetical protein